MKLVAALLLVLLSATAQADIFRPAYLELREAGPDAAGTPVYDVLWKVPAQGDLRMPARVRLPAGTKVSPSRRACTSAAHTWSAGGYRAMAGWSGRKSGSMA